MLISPRHTKNCLALLLAGAMAGAWAAEPALAPAPSPFPRPMTAPPKKNQTTVSKEQAEMAKLGSPMVGAAGHSPASERATAEIANESSESPPANSNVVRVISEMPDQAQAEKMLRVELSDRLAELSRKQDEILEQLEQTNSRVWLLYIYAFMTSIGLGLLGRAWLMMPKTKKGKKAKSDIETGIFPDGAAAGTAHITIRDGSTQETGLHQVIATKRVVKRTGDTQRETKRLSASQDPSAVFAELGIFEAERIVTESIVKAADGDTQRRSPGRLTAVETGRTEKHDTSRSSGRLKAIGDGEAAKTTVSPAITRLFQNKKQVDLTSIPLENSASALASKATGEAPPAPAPAAPEAKPETNAFEAPDQAPPAKSGFSLMEIMISLAVLATISASLISGLYTLDLSRRASKETSQVQELGRALAERVLGAQWDWLGKDRPDDASGAYLRGAWSWHRRAAPRSPGILPLNPPMTQEAQQTENNLISQKLLGQKTGIENLKVYLEYYKQAVIEDQFGASDPYGNWRRITNPTDLSSVRFMYTESPADFELSQTTESLVVRIFITWDSVAGGSRQHEVVLSRRK